ncbi:MAG: class I SAM-dependent methyltransferase [Candidatus Diapherotrites archaeon]
MMGRTPKKGWKFFSTYYYRKGEQPFRTYLTSAWENLPKISEKIKSLVPNPERSTAIEIGPALIPVLQYHPFKEKIYVEGSPALAARIKKGGHAKGSKIISGNIRNLPLLRRIKADIIVANEVLAHIWPEERLQTVADIAGRTNALLIIDRLKIPFDKFRTEMAGSKLDEKRLKMSYTQRVDFKEIIRLLRERGFEVKAETDVAGGTKYVILTAKRKEL